jgi:hypothetical protein
MQWLRYKLKRLIERKSKKSKTSYLKLLLISKQIELNNGNIQNISKIFNKKINSTVKNFYIVI